MSLPSKPREGDRCNGCGICCALEICPAGKIAFPGAVAPCPALKLAPNGSRTFCQLVMAEVVFGLEPMLQKALGIGLGCSMTDNDEPIARGSLAVKATVEGLAS